MKLKDILSLKDEIIIGSSDIEIKDISYDSRKIEKDSVFFALPGHRTDGKKYINNAIAKGACAIVTDEKVEDLPITQIIVKDVYKYMTQAAAKFYNNPDKELFIIGITGTNGKTTITYMIESILACAGIKSGVIGTINYRYGDKIFDAPNTTPQSLDIYKIMRDMLDSGIKYLIMEVSSHALALGRVEGIEFDEAVFTNLTQDHLDMHKDMENYFQAKSILFKELGKGIKSNIKYAIINADDKYGKKLSKINLNCEIKLYSAKEDKTGIDLKAENIDIGSSESKFDIVFNNEKKHIIINQIGLHNIYNALAAIGAVIGCGIPLDKAIEGICKLSKVPGRLEPVDTKNFGFEAVIDYAHTDDALKNVLSALKKIKYKRIITVFGCGGDRDRIKRPLMGKVAVEMSDFVFVTSDNPRTEDPKQIMLDIEVGIKRTGKKNYKVIEDRELAIKEAVIMAEKGDIILIAGKGHETYQIIGNEKIHFNDAEIVKKYIKFREEEKQKSVSKQIEQKEFIF